MNALLMIIPVSIGLYFFFTKYGEKFTNVEYQNYIAKTSSASPNGIIADYSRPITGDLSNDYSLLDPSAWDYLTGDDIKEIGQIDDFVQTAGFSDYGNALTMPQVEANKTDLQNLAAYIAESYRVEPAMILALIDIESGWNPKAVNPSDPSYGLMQLLATTDSNGNITNRLPAIPTWPPDSISALFDPKTNIDYGCQILAWNLSQFGFPKGVAVYNNWGAKDSNQLGPYPGSTSDYMKKFMARYAANGGKLSTKLGY